MSERGFPILYMGRDDNDDCHCWLCEEARERQRKRDVKEDTMSDKAPVAGTSEERPT